MANIKEATPILWKTPLNLFFESNDLKDFQKDLWPPLAKALFAEKFSVVITDLAAVSPSLSFPVLRTRWVNWR